MGVVNPSAPTKVAFPTGVSTPAVTAPGSVTTPQVVNPSAPTKVAFPTGVSTTAMTGTGALQFATVKGTTSVNTPSVTVSTTGVTAPGEISGGTVVGTTSVTTPQVVNPSAPTKVAFPTGVSTTAMTGTGALQFATV